MPSSETQVDVAPGDIDPELVGQEKAAIDAVDTADADATDLDATSGGAASESAEKWASIRDTLKSLDYDASKFEDDDAALKHLVEQARQASVLEKQAAEAAELAKWGRQYVEHAGDFQQYLASRQQQQEPEKPKLWDPPEWNPNWLNQVRRGEDGELIPDTANGGTPETVRKVQQYAAWRQDQQDRFWQDPYSFMRPYVEQEASRLAKETVDRELGNYSHEIQARQFVEANKNWLYEADQSGQPKVANGQPVLSGDGRVFVEGIRKAQAWGVPVERQQDVAMTLLNEYRLRTKVETPADKQTKFLKQAAAQSTPGMAANDSSSESGIAQGPTKGSLYDQMLSDMKANGFNLHDDLVSV